MRTNDAFICRKMRTNYGHIMAFEPIVSVNGDKYAPRRFRLAAKTVSVRLKCNGTGAEMGP